MTDYYIRDNWQTTQLHLSGSYTFNVIKSLIKNVLLLLFQYTVLYYLLKLNFLFLQPPDEKFPKKNSVSLFLSQHHHYRNFFSYVDFNIMMTQIYNKRLLGIMKKIMTAITRSKRSPRLMNLNHIYPIGKFIFYFLISESMTCSSNLLKKDQLRKTMDNSCKVQQNLWWFPNFTRI